MGEKAVLSVREVLQKTHEELKKKLQGEEIAFEHKPHAEIANDSDWHRSRTGFMIYESVFLAETGKRWVVAFGRKGGSYPGDKYDSDITAVRIPEKEGGYTDGELAKKAYELLEHSEYFRNSLVFGLYNGMLCCNRRSPFGEKMHGGIASLIADFIVSGIKTDDRVFHLDLRAVVTEAMRYEPGVVDFLVDVIEDVLKFS